MAAVIDRAAFQRLGGWNERIRASADATILTGGDQGDVRAGYRYRYDFMAAE